MQKIDISDPLPRIHTELFTTIHRECQIAYVGHVYKQALIDANNKQQNGSHSNNSTQGSSGRRALSREESGESTYDDLI